MAGSIVFDHSAGAGTALSQRGKSLDGVNVPELPEVETVRRGLAPAMERAAFLAVAAHREDLRWPLPQNFARRLVGAEVEALRRRAKYLLADLSSGEVLIMHLGMSGSFRVLDGAAEEVPGAFHFPRARALAHDHVVFRMSSGATVTFNDPRRFGFMLLVPRAELAKHPLMRIGPEPLDPEFTAARLAKSCAGRATSLKAALLDQKTVAGLGNIYVCEALNRARLSPRRRASTLATRTGAPTPSAARLVAAIKVVLEDAIAAGGSSLRDHRRTDGELGSFQHKFRVYDREGGRCRNRGCPGIVRRMVQNGRSTFLCPVCQK
jgi:formamidopyrimidine-DNA glycosylase